MPITIRTAPPNSSALEEKDGAELLPQKNAGQADDKSDDADGGRPPAASKLQVWWTLNGGGKDDPGGQRVDAGGDRHGDEHFKADRFAASDSRPPAPFDGFIDHLSADVTQQDKSDPMVQLTDDPFAHLADQPADDGHDRLKDARSRGDAQGVLRTDVLVMAPLVRATAKASIERPTAMPKRAK